MWKLRTFAVARRKLWTVFKTSAVPPRGGPIRNVNNSNTSSNVLRTCENVNTTENHTPYIADARMSWSHRSSTASPTVAPHWPRSPAANTAVLPPMIAVVQPSNRSGNSMGSPCPHWHRQGSAVLPPWFRSSTARKNTCVPGRGKLWVTTGGVTTELADLTKNRSGTAPPVWRGYYGHRTTHETSHIHDVSKAAQGPPKPIKQLLS